MTTFTEHINNYIMQRCIHFYISWTRESKKARMIVIIVILLFTFSLGDDIHPQQSKKCVIDTDVHELLMKLKCELAIMKEKVRTLKAFKGKLDYNYICFRQILHML